jgi:predicted permease
MNLALSRPLVSLRNLMILAAKGEDKKSKKQLKQGLKTIFLSPPLLSIFQQI